MKTQELKPIDLTEGDAATAPGAVIIHDTFGGKPSVIAYCFYVWEALDELLWENLPEEYKHLTEDYAFAYMMGNEDLSGYESALGARIELYSDYLKRSNTMNTQDIQVIDHTDGDADKVSGTVIIHDEVGGQPSIISYDWEIAENLEGIAGPLPEDYAHIPEEYATAWTSRSGDLSGYEAALGARIEHFEDFLKENSGEWEAPGGRIVKDEPTWTYPEDLISETPKK